MFPLLPLLRSRRREVMARTSPKSQRKSSRRKGMKSSQRRIRRQPRRTKRRKREDKEEKGHRNWEGRGEKETIKMKRGGYLPTTESQTEIRCWGETIVLMEGDGMRVWTRAKTCWGSR